VQHKIRFLEVAESYMNEIQQVRRYEKNYLLYGTNLDDALQHLALAQKIMAEKRDKVIKVISLGHYGNIIKGTEEYAVLLKRIGESSDARMRTEIEGRLRSHGAQMIRFAADFAGRERQAVDRTFHLVKRVTFGFLVVLMAMMLVASLFINNEILKNLHFLRGYTDRIAAGDFTHITPRRWYRDEFTQMAMAINHMIDELEKRQKILVESHKIRAIGNLVAGVAHELNNPLNNILLTAASLEEDYEVIPREEKKEMIADVIGETERAQKIVRNLLDFARESETRIERLDLNKTLQKAIDLVSNQVKIAKIRLETYLPDNLPPVHGDEQLLGQVFVNLILNAVDVLPQRQGRITISIDKDRQDGYVAVSITDNGPGIPEHILRRIFDPFFTTKPEGKGTGLGLSVSRGIVQQLGGYIRAESEVGKGTAFTVFLPTTDIPFRTTEKNELIREGEEAEKTV
jgi:signal transduction histidine kinase